MIDPYGIVFRRALWPAWESGLRHRPTISRLRSLEQTQFCSSDELWAIQSAAIQRLVRHAWDHVPFYRARMEAVGVAPESVRSPDDLALLPILLREEARAAEKTRASTAPPRCDIHKSTSGTMGMPLSFGYDLGSEHWRQAVKWRGYGWAGYQPGDRSLHFWGGRVWPPPPRAARAKIALDHLLHREHYIDCTARGEADLDAVVAAIRRLRPQVLVAYTQAAAELSRHVVRRGLRTWPDIPVLCGAERLFASDRAIIAEAFGPRVFETYGCRETMLIAAECEAHAGLHVQSENLVVELVVREGGRERPARPGETGEVVLTDLHNYGMPFIRYANGDLAVAAEEGTCACGRALPRLAAVEGRVTEALRDGAGARVSGLIFNVAFAGELARAIRQFQAVQHTNGAITLRIVPADGFDDGCRERIQRTLKPYLHGAPLHIERVAEIPLLPSGKRQVVVVERG